MRTDGGQIEYIGENIAEKLLFILENEDVKCPFFVIGTAFRRLNLENIIKKQYPRAVFFDEFLPNPSYDSIVLGKSVFWKYNCDFIVAIGGGSAIDVSKAIKAYAFMDESECYLSQEIKDNGIKILAIPTTAGTGSEATHFGVIYHKGIKESVSHKGLLPDYVILDAKALEFLPIYQRKATMLDALCHSIESLWSVNLTDKSVEYADKAIKNILDYKEKYLSNQEDGNLEMLRAANYAGKAINITKTTAAHAMSYKMTSIYGISHGHSAALCLPRVWEYMINNMDKCVDSRGKEFLYSAFKHICSLLGYSKLIDAIGYLDNLIFNELQMDKPIVKSNDEIKELVQSVNTERLKNNPVFFEDSALEEIYGKILL